MIHKHVDYYLHHIKEDVAAGIVVFLVAVPLCLGIALASGAPLFSGLIAGMVGGLFVSFFSGSQLSVSGPAAGLTVIVLNAIENLGSFQGFLVAVVLAGFLQIIFGFLKGGIIGAFFPASVIKGMLAAIGLILIIKQVPHALGYEVSFEGDESYMNETAESSFFELLRTFSHITPGAAIISSVSLLILIAWETAFIQKRAILSLVPGPLIVVVWGLVYNALTLKTAPEWAVNGQQLVTLPVIESPMDFFDYLMLPDFSYLSNPQVYIIAVTLAIIASLETLLSLEAVDKLDPLKRLAPTNRELLAQGSGNIISGMVGGLPITAVIVRSSANINAGGRTSLASLVHGVCLTFSVVFLSYYLNFIPLACLAAILLHTGYKLANPKLILEYYKKGMIQLLPFVVTVIAILMTDLLKGMAVGMTVGLFYVIRANYHAAITLTQDGSHYLMSLNKDVSFLNKALLRRFILQIEENSTVTIDASKAQFIDHDILETLEDFMLAATDDNISVEVIEMHGKQELREYEPIVILNGRKKSA